MIAARAAACCSSSYFVRIWPKEKQALARINKNLLAPAPGEPKGQVLMGYDKKGRCPMLKDNKCSIFEHRPRTCENATAGYSPPPGSQRATITAPR